MDFYAHEKETDGWLDITDEQAEKILDVEDLDFDTREFEQNKWVKKLGFETSMLKNPQVRWETLHLFIQMCDRLEQIFAAKGQSLDGKITRSIDEWSSPTKIYFALYQVASMHVSRHYSQEKPPTFEGHWYLILQKFFKVSTVKDIYQLALNNEALISAPNVKTRHAFFLNENGTKSVHWDVSGSLREKQSFSDQELTILNRTPERQVALWEIEEVRSEIIRIYLQIWEEVIYLLPKVDLWKPFNRQKVLRFVDDSQEFVAWQEDTNFAAALLRLAENKVREILPKAAETKPIRVDGLLKEVQEFYPLPLTYSLRGILANYEKNLTETSMDNMLDGLFYYGIPTPQLLPFALLRKHDVEQWTRVLVQYQKDSDYAKSIAQTFKKTKEADLSLLLAYELTRFDKLKTLRNQRVRAILPDRNVRRFWTLAEEKQPLTFEIAATIMAFKKDDYHETITLDQAKIVRSRIDLDETVALLDAFIEPEAEVVAPKEKVTAVKKPTSAGVVLVRELLEKESLPISELQQKAQAVGKLVTVYLSDINKAFFELVNDQLIIIENDKVKIDPYYVEIAKEILSEDSSKS